MISDFTQLGGAGTYLVNIVDQALSDSWDIVILFDVNDEIKPLKNELVDKGVEVICKPLYHGHYPEEMIKENTQIILDRYAPDLVHVICGSPRSAIISREVVCKNHIPLLFTETYVPYDFDMTEITRKRLQHLYKSAFAVTTVCKGNVENLEHLIQLDMSNIHVIPSSVAHVRERQVSDVKRDKYKAIFIGRLVKQKGVDILLEALNIMEKNYLERIHISIYGDGCEKDHLKCLADQYELNPYISFVGWCDNLEEELDQYDFAIVPSRDEGGLPFSILLLLSRAIPCIVSNTKGIQEATNGGAFARLFQLGNPQDLALSLKEFINDPKPLHRKAMNGISYIKENYLTDVNMKKVVRLWHATVTKNEKV